MVIVTSQHYFRYENAILCPVLSMYLGTEEKDKIYILINRYGCRSLGDKIYSVLEEHYLPQKHIQQIGYILRLA